MCLCAFLCCSMCDVKVFIFSKRRLHGAELSRTNLWVTGSWTLGKLQAAASQQEKEARAVCSADQLQINNSAALNIKGNATELTN